MRCVIDVRAGIIVAIYLKFRRNSKKLYKRDDRRSAMNCFVKFEKRSKAKFGLRGMFRVEQILVVLYIISWRILNL